MNANNDPLGVRSAYRSAGQIGGKAFWSLPVAKPAFFLWPHRNCGHYFSAVSRADSRPKWIKSLALQTGHSKYVTPGELFKAVDSLARSQMRIDASLMKAR